MARLLPAEHRVGSLHGLEDVPIAHRRAQDAVDSLWRYTGELFMADQTDESLARVGLAPDLAVLEPKWRAQAEPSRERRRWPL